MHFYHLVIFCFAFVHQIALSQPLNNTEVKTAYIFRFAENIEWPNEKNIEEFTIGVYGTDTAIIASLNTLANEKSIKDAPIKVFHFENISNIIPTNILFISKENNLEIKRIFKQHLHPEVLLITDEFENSLYTMLNFISASENKLSFEINKHNIENNRLQILPKLILLGGTELDVRSLYKKKEAELKKEKELVILQQNEILKQEKYIDFQVKKITDQTKLIQENQIKSEEQNTLIVQHKDSLETLASNIKTQHIKLQNKEQQLNKYHNDILEQKNEITNLDKNYKSEQASLKELENEIELKKELLQRQERNLIDLEGKLEGQRIKMILMSLLIFLVLVFVIYVAKNNKDKQRLNEKLTNNNTELNLTLNELKITQSQLVQSEKMASVGTLISGIAHEINNPLNFIQGGKTAMELYFNDYLPDHLSELKVYIEMIDTGILRASNVVNV